MNDPLVVELETIEEKTAIDMPFFEQADERAKKAKTIVVTSAEQTKVEKKRKQLKKDGMATIIKYLIIPYFQQQEGFVKRKEARRKEKCIDL